MGTTGVRYPLFTGCLLVLFSTAAGVPAPAATAPQPRATLSPAAARAHRIAAAALYSRRSRRLVQSYLRLKMLEMRQGDLERVRKVLDRKLGIDGLLGETPPPLAR